jgi:hypothetical protein
MLYLQENKKKKKKSFESTNKTSQSRITVEKYNKNTQKNTKVKNDTLPVNSLQIKLRFPCMNSIILP